MRVSLTSKEVERCCFADLLRFKVIYLWGATNPFSTARLVWNDIPFGGLHKQQHSVSICSVIFVIERFTSAFDFSKLICVKLSPTSLNYCRRLQVFFCRIRIENVIDGVEVGILVTMSKESSLGLLLKNHPYWHAVKSLTYINSNSKPLCLVPAASWGHAIINAVCRLL